MKTHFKILSIAGLALPLLLSSCVVEDPGPIQYTERTYPISDFDRLDMGSAFQIEVVQGSTFGVKATGDLRNIDDLDVFRSGSTLIVQYSRNATRRHETRIFITMPDLKEANFSGASKSLVEGFNGNNELKFTLSGASFAQLSADHSSLHLDVSGASKLVLNGEGESLWAMVTGASELAGFDYPVSEARIEASGASVGKVTVSTELEAIASGASTVRYRGNPSVSSNVSGGSSVRKD